MRAQRSLAVLVLAVLGGSAGAQVTNPITTGTLQTNLFRIVNIPTATQAEPIDLVTIPGDGGNRLFVATHKGFIRLVKDNALQSTAFLDLTGRVPLLGGSGSDERGLLGIAFNPNFYAPEGTAGRGKFYTFTSESKVGNADFFHPEIGPTGGDNQSVIREWTVNLSNPDVADTTVASRVLMRIAHPQSNHNGGALRFGNDGMLYISLGDGGGGDDYFGSVTSTTDGHTSPNGNGQDLTVPHGKIFRIDPTGSNSTNGKYGIPADNPFVNSTTAIKEIFAYGLRNPFRINFDRPTAKLYVGDVGQNVREEVDIVTSGGNYGWAFMEGTRVNTIAGRTIPPGFTSIAPIAEYTHSDGHSITGGYVYHGSVPEWQGKYIFGDYTGNANAGRLFYMDQNGGTIFQFNNALSGGSLYAFGEDADGELYALMNTGAVDKLLAPNAWNVDGGGSWGTAANWSPNAIPTFARFLNRLTRTGGPAIVTLDGTRVVSSLTISNPNQYIIAQGTGGTLEIGSAEGVHILRGSHIISAPLSIRGSPAFPENVNLEVLADSQLTISGPFTFGLGALVKTGPGALVLSNASGVVGSPIAVREGQLRLDANMGSPANATTAARRNLQITASFPATGVGNSLVTLNADQDLSILRSSFSNPGLQSVDLNSPSTPAAFRSVRIYGNLPAEYSTVASAVANAILNPGDGIYDSRIMPFSNMRIGIVQSADAHGDQHLFMRPTMIGDLNLDGTVTISDFIDLAANFQMTNARWQDGDVNYDSAVTIADFIALASNFNTNYAGEIFPIDPAEQKMLNEFYAANVPEPGVGGLMGLGMLLLARRRGRRQSSHRGMVMST